MDYEQRARAIRREGTRMCEAFDKMANRYFALLNEYYSRVSELFESGHGYKNKRIVPSRFHPECVELRLAESTPLIHPHIIREALDKYKSLEKRLVYQR